MNLFGCNHKYSKVQEDGYQYCEKCGIAILPPKPAEPEVKCQCQHKMVIHDTFKVLKHGKWVSSTYVLRCTECGLMVNHSDSV